MKSPHPVWSAITPDYFRVMRIPLLKGRFFTGGDNASTAAVAILSQSIARQLWENEDPIGKQVNVAGLIGEGFLLALIGATIGTAAALGLTRLLSSLLYGVRSADPFTFLAVPIVLMGVAVAACAVPARRAMRVDPVVALRYE
jgi:MacB-like periplasmic core domain